MCDTTVLGLPESQYNIFYLRDTLILVGEMSSSFLLVHELIPTQLHVVAKV